MTHTHIVGFIMSRPRPRGYKTFSMLNLAEHEIYSVGILTFISMIKTTPYLKQVTSSFVGILAFISS